MKTLKTTIRISLLLAASIAMSQCKVNDSNYGRTYMDAAEDGGAGGGGGNIHKLIDASTLEVRLGETFGKIFHIEAREKNELESIEILFFQIADMRLIQDLPQPMITIAFTDTLAKPVEMSHIHFNLTGIDNSDLLIEDIVNKSELELANEIFSLENYSMTSHARLAWIGLRDFGLYVETVFSRDAGTSLAVMLANIKHILALGGEEPAHLKMSNVVRHLVLDGSPNAETGFIGEGHEVLVIAESDLSNVDVDDPVTKDFDAVQLDDMYLHDVVGQIEITTTIVKAIKTGTLNTDKEEHAENDSALPRGSSSGTPLVK